MLTDAELASFDTNLKVNPPLRTEKDRRAVVKGVCDGTIDAIATDHAPHTNGEKEVEFDNAPPGMVGFETAFSLGYETFVLSRKMRLPQYVAKLTAAPATILGLPMPSVAAGDMAELVILDLKAKWTYTADNAKSQSFNSPFLGRELRGRVTGGILPGGRLWSEPAD
jgi:dihydroorotase